MAETYRYGLLGEKLSHSFSPKLHHLLGNSSYGLFEVAPEELEDFIKAKNYDGLNVTIPYKIRVMEYLDEIDESARLIGSVNTIVNRKGKLIGYNTDGAGFDYMLQKYITQFDKEKIIVLGSGGASLTVQAMLKKRGASHILVCSRKGNLNYENIYEHQDATWLIQTTPVGMYPNEKISPIDISRFPNIQYVFDLIYNPLETKLLKEAKACGKIVENGLDMLLVQAIRSEEIFFNQGFYCLRMERIRKSLLNAIKER